MAAISIDPLATKPLTVLVGSRDRNILRLFQVQLARQGMRAICVDNGLDALDAVRHESFDRAILDQDLPFVAGYEVLSAIRTRAETHRTHVTLVLRAGEDIVQWQQKGFRADRYVYPAFEARELLL